MLLQYEGGFMADSSELDSTGTVIFTILDGSYEGKTLYFHTQKHNCGAWSEELCCLNICWKNGVNGCPQHQRPEEGNRLLKSFVKPAYEVYAAAERDKLLHPIVMKKKKELALQPS
jgi:hypothetical protein